jgi:hypothetical protein
VRVRTDLAEPACVTPAEFDWVDSPVPGIMRMMLERSGDEEAVATSLVRFAPGASFPHHAHPHGEEFVVLDGDFRDETGCFTAGRYLRHPPGTSHAPLSQNGCVIFVRLRQFDADDRRLVDVNLATFEAAPENSLAADHLHCFGDEEVTFVRGRRGASLLQDSHPGGWELFVLEGSVAWHAVDLPRWSWLRLPAGQPLDVRFSADAALYLRARPHRLARLFSDPPTRTAASRGR